MNAIPVAKLTFKELLKEKAFLGLLLFEVFLLFVSKLISNVVAGDTVKVAMDFALAFFFFTVALFSIFASVGSTFRDISDKVVYLILSKPLKRRDYVLGKFLGVAGAVALFTFFSFFVVTAGILTISSLSNLYVPHVVAVERVFLVSILTCMMGIFLSAFGLLFAVLFTSQILALLSVLFLFFAGLELSPVKELVTSSKYVSPINKVIVQLAYYLFPNFSLFDIKDYAVHLSLTVSPLYFLLVSVYFLIYTSAVLVVSTLLFERREL